MRLKKYKVTQFRSVEDSGWIETDGVTALIGTNESGKTNLLLPLWKLNPAADGEIDKTSDYPRKHFTDFRRLSPQPEFVEAVFDVGEDVVTKLTALTGEPAEALSEVSIARRYDGDYVVDFPRCPDDREVSADSLRGALEHVRDRLAASTPMATEVELADQMRAAVDSALGLVTSDSPINLEQASAVQACLAATDVSQAPKTSKMKPIYLSAQAAANRCREDLAKPHPRESEAATDLILEKLPYFVYFSNYGNLDSEIYLPHVIENLAREDLGQKELAKARTLKVLFKFVGLSPEEILELGQELGTAEHEIKLSADKKRQRSILLQSASTKLTQSFRDWWKQGDYRFRFEADGNHFRIWVSDDRRSEEVELESRSTGLQWFLSFYLVFLVESEDAHHGCVLLLDEPGLSLHPLAQRDLSTFFESLASRNQLLYTTHSPFLVDADRLDRARKVYVDADGTSRASADLGASTGDISVRGAAYAVHAAVGLSIAESLLLGCKPVIVEGASDQHYLTAIKTVLVRAGRLSPSHEYVFPPAGGVKGVKAIAAILGGRDEELPHVLVDSDRAGNEFARALKSSLYSGEDGRVAQVADFVELEGAEIEDLIPHDVLVDVIDRWQRMPEERFADVVQSDKPVVEQIEAWAESNDVTLEKPGWKVELSKRIKRRLLAQDAATLAPEVLDRWSRVFAALN